MLLQTRVFRSLFHTAHAAPTFQAAQAKIKSPLAKLRKKTGYSISLCKKALETTEQDVGKAEEWLKEQALTQGWAKANKLEGRNTMQGLIGLLIRGQSASMIELNCETDFVARNQQFHELLNEISAINLKQAPATTGVNHVSKDQLLSLTTSKGQSLADLVALNIGQIGENIVLRRGVTLTAAEGMKVAGITHPSVAKSNEHIVEYGRYGSLATYTAEEGKGEFPNGQNTSSMARQFCQHIIGMNPTVVGDLSSLPPPRSEEQREMEAEEKRAEMEASADDPDKPAIRKREPNVLIDQDFLLDSEKTLGEVLQETAMEVREFVRFEVGQALPEEEE